MSSYFVRKYSGFVLYCMAVYLDTKLLSTRQLRRLCCESTIIPSCVYFTRTSTQRYEVCYCMLCCSAVMPVCSTASCSAVTAASSSSCCSARYCCMPATAEVPSLLQCRYVSPTLALMALSLTLTLTGLKSHAPALLYTRLSRPKSTQPSRKIIHGVLIDRVWRPVS